jgi:hypothetical protein
VLNEDTNQSANGSDLSSAFIQEHSALLRIAEILDGHVHVAHDNEAPIVFDGHANCYEDGL